MERATLAGCRARPERTSQEKCTCPRANQWSTLSRPGVCNLGEGSNVTFTLAVIGAAARSSKIHKSLSPRFRTNEVTYVLILAKRDACIPGPRQHPFSGTRDSWLRAQ